MVVDNRAVVSWRFIIDGPFVRGEIRSGAVPRESSRQLSDMPEALPFCDSRSSVMLQILNIAVLEFQSLMKQV